MFTTPIMLGGSPSDDAAKYLGAWPSGIFIDFFKYFFFPFYNQLGVVSFVQWVMIITNFVDDH